MKCPICEGRGKVFRREDLPPATVIHQCPLCEGSGKDPTPPAPELVRLAEKHPPPDKWWDE